MHIGLTFDLQTDPHDERQAEFDPPVTIDALRQALETLGHHVTLMGDAEELLRGGFKRWCDVDLVFNIAEGRWGRCREAWVPILLDLFNIPYVGSDALALSLGLDKVMSKRLAVAAGISTPQWISVNHPGLLPSSIPLRFPVIVKPRWEGSGRGIDPGAVVHDAQGLAHRAAWLFERCPEPILIEEFVGQGELTVCVIGNDPPTAYPAIQRPIDPATRLSYHVVKPAPASWESPIALDETLDARARTIACAMVETLDVRDVARVDLRADEQGQLWFLEINPLPSFDPAQSLGLLAEYLGVTYADIIGRILDAALQRFDYARI